MDENKKRTIFIIDDDSFLLDMYALKFSQSGYNVITALGSTQALDKLTTGVAPDVMLLDILMPEMDGFEFLEKMRDEPIAQNAYKIVFSNRGEASDMKRGEELGVAGYIVKANTTPTEVIEKVNTIINKNVSVASAVPNQ